MREVELQRIFTPETIYGHKLQNVGEAADVIRLKVLYEEGGMSLRLVPG